MRASHCGCIALLLALSGAALGAEPGDPPKTGTADKDKKARPDPLRLPSDAIIFICEQGAEALRLVPDAVVLSPAQYQKLLDELARLREQLRPKRVVPPSRCQIKGKIEGRNAVLQAVFDFVTEREGAVITLACPQANLSSAALDGRTPLLRSDADGFTVQVDKPGEHQATLELLVPLTDRGPAPAPPRLFAREVGRGWQGLELALPRAAVTTIELDLPSGARDVRIAGKPWADTLVSLKNNHLAGGLGPADRLDLAWRVPSAGIATLRTAEGRIRVRLDASGVTASAELILRAEGGTVADWRIVAPRGATVRAMPADESRLKGPIEAANLPNPALAEYTLKLLEASAEPLTVLVTTHAPVPRSGTPVSLGPFEVRGASQQSGKVELRKALPDVHVEGRPRGDLVYRQQPIDEERRADPALIAAFRYTSSGAGPALDIEVQPLSGQVKTRTSHLLSLRPDGANGALAWYITTTLVATPRWADVDQVQVFVPPSWEPLDDTPVPADRVLTLKLPRPPGGEAPRPVTLVLEGRYYADNRQLGGGGRPELGLCCSLVTGYCLSPTACCLLPTVYGLLPAGDWLPLPRPRGVFEQGGEVTVQVSSDKEVALVGAAASGLEPVRGTAHEMTFRGRPLPEFLAVGWKPFVPDVAARAVLDLTWKTHGGEVARHEIRCQFAGPPPSLLALRVPAGVTDLRVLAGGTLAAGGAAITPPTTASSEHSVVLAYSVRPVPAGKDSAFVVPLVSLEQPTQVPTKVRFWCPDGTLHKPDAPPWEEQPIEEVADRKDLPILVLESPRGEAPLVLYWAESTARFAVLVDRGVVRVTLGEGGSQGVHARYRLRHLTGRYLDVELPLPVSLVDLKAMLRTPGDRGLGDARSLGFEAVDDAGHASGTGHMARLRLGPDLVRTGSVLELEYSLPPGQASTGASGPLSTTLVPPVLHGDPGTVAVCWQVVVPPSWVVLGPESGPAAERAWARHGWLLAPRLSRGAVEAGFEGLGPVPEANNATAVVCWRGGGEPLTLTHVTQLAWWLACSPMLLILGLALYGWWGPHSLPATRHPQRAGLALGLLAVAVGAGAVLRPAILSAIAYGCEPGACVLVVALLVQWLRHEHYRRQVVFLPSFSRAAPSSSLVRGGSDRGPMAEPSTVDVPHAQSGQ
jgi:hypothetical protein